MKPMCAAEWGHGEVHWRVRESLHCEVRGWSVLHVEMDPPPVPVEGRGSHGRGAAVLRYSTEGCSMLY